MKYIIEMKQKINKSAITHAIKEAYYDYHILDAVKEAPDEQETE